MHADYVRWCNEHGIEPLLLVRFGKIAAAIWRKERVGGRVFYLDVPLIPMAVAA
jgi:hypothetical protein